MKVAVLGLGFMGSTHLRAMKNIPHAELVAVCSDDPVKLGGDLSAIQGNLGTTGERMDFSQQRKYRNIDDCLRDREVEAVDLCLPTFLHAPAAIAALRAGKHVLVEKPMALTYEETQEMLREAEEAGRVLMCAQVLRFFPAYNALAETLPQLGPVRGAFFRRRCAGPAWTLWSADASKSGGGVFDLLIHDVDQMLRLFGMPESVSATGYEDLPRKIDCIEARFHYANGLTVNMTGGWHHPKAYPFSMEYTVTADGGTIDYFSDGRPVPKLYGPDGSAAPLPLEEADGFQAEIEYFLDCAIHNRAPVRCPPAESAEAVRLTLAMVESRKRKGELLSCRH